MVERHHSGSALIQLIIALTILGILTAAAIPSFRSLQARAHQAETVGNLSRIFTSEITFYAEEARYGSFDEIGFSLIGVSRLYTYRSPATGGAGGSTGTISVDLLVPQGGVTSPDNTAVPSAGSAPTPTISASFTATATGNIDSDPTMDQWHVNDLKQGILAADSDDSSG